VANPILPTGMSPELKTFYSKQLLSRLIPALQHADHPLDDSAHWEWEGLPPSDNQEFVEEVNKWKHYFNGTVVN
jgi:hypothetical protein